MGDFAEKLYELVENDQVDNAIDLNELFLSQALDVKPEDLAKM